ncbi:MAG: HAD-IB family hydrolase [Candidatus Liptonbacteria bacterium]|nr:HAD-IB family hydrolase [Candidatus Liptonbacteria bacterium]
MREKKIAIFDVDGTIFRSSLLVKLVEELVNEKIFEPGVEKHYAKAREAWLNREGQYGTYIKGVIKAFEENIPGVRYADFRRVAHRVVVREKGRTYRYTRELIKDLKKKGYFVLAISHSPKLVVENFCKTLGFSRVYGIMNDVDRSGKFTGKILFPEIIFDKAKILKRVLAKGGTTLKGSIGAGDTESDIPFLKMVERPICFNPNSKLYKYAKRAGWEIVVERKDVVYHHT